MICQKIFNLTLLSIIFLFDLINSQQTLSNIIDMFGSSVKVNLRGGEITVSRMQNQTFQIFSFSLHSLSEKNDDGLCYGQFQEKTNITDLKSIEFIIENYNTTVQIGENQAKQMTFKTKNPLSNKSTINVNITINGNDTPSKVEDKDFKKGDILIEYIIGLWDFCDTSKDNLKTGNCDLGNKNFLTSKHLDLTLKTSSNSKLINFDNKFIAIYENSKIKFNPLYAKSKLFLDGGRNDADYYILRSDLVSGKKQIIYQFLVKFYEDNFNLPANYAKERNESIYYKGNFTNFTINAYGGKIEAINSIKKVKENSIKFYMSYDKIIEKDQEGREAGIIEDKNSYKNFGITKFEIMDVTFINNLKNLNFISTLKSYLPKIENKGDIFTGFILYEKDTDVTLVNNNYISSIKEGDLKVDINITGWNFCKSEFKNNKTEGNCHSINNKVQNGTFLDLRIKLETVSKYGLKWNGFVKDKKLIYEDTTITIPREYISDGKIVSMPDGYPRVDNTDSGDYLNLRFPRFENSVKYEYVVNFNVGSSIIFLLSLVIILFFIVSVIFLIYCCYCCCCRKRWSGVYSQSIESKSNFI